MTYGIGNPGPGLGLVQKFSINFLSDDTLVADISFYFCEKPASLRQTEVKINTPPPHRLNFLVIGSPPPNRIYFQETTPPNIKKKYGFTPTTNRKIKKMVFPPPR
jgi:hypothetical protein